MPPRIPVLYEALGLHRFNFQKLGTSNKLSLA
jgi:hypothetical protein